MLPWIKRPLGQEIVSSVGRAEDFDQEIGRAFDTPTGANGRPFREQHDDIWLHGIGAFEEDVERVRVAREAVGPGVGLAIDANNAWTPSIALGFMREVESLDIAWLEEPVATEDLVGSAELAHQLDVRRLGIDSLNCC